VIASDGSNEQTFIPPWQTNTSGWWLPFWCNDPRNRQGWRFM